MSAPVPGSRWLDRRPAGGAGWRRIVEVVAVDTPDGNGFVSGVGWWQQLVGGQWRDDTAPGARRRTRIRVAAFLRGYEMAPEPVEEEPKQ